MTFEEVRAALKQRFPMIMVDLVLSLDQAKASERRRMLRETKSSFWVIFPSTP
jgi:hypothetical protein